MIENSAQFSSAIQILNSDLSTTLNSLMFSRDKLASIARKLRRYPPMMLGLDLGRLVENNTFACQLSLTASVAPRENFGEVILANEELSKEDRYVLTLFHSFLTTRQNPLDVGASVYVITKQRLSQFYETSLVNLYFALMQIKFHIPVAELAPYYPEYQNLEHCGKTGLDFQREQLWNVTSLALQSNNLPFENVLAFLKESGIEYMNYIRNHASSYICNAFNSRQLSNPHDLLHYVSRVVQIAAPQVDDPENLAQRMILEYSKCKTTPYLMNVITQIFNAANSAPMQHFSTLASTDQSSSVITNLTTFTTAIPVTPESTTASPCETPNDAQVIIPKEVQEIYEAYLASRKTFTPEGFYCPFM